MVLRLLQKKKIISRFESIRLFLNTEFASYEKISFQVCLIIPFRSAKMESMERKLVAPNGRKITLQTGLFIDNEWVNAIEGGRIESINPT